MRIALLRHGRPQSRNGPRFRRAKWGDGACPSRCQQVATELTTRSVIPIGLYSMNNNPVALTANPF